MEIKKILKKRKEEEKIVPGAIFTQIVFKPSEQEENRVNVEIIYIRIVLDQ